MRAQVMARAHCKTNLQEMTFYGFGNGFTKFSVLSCNYGQSVDKRLGVPSQVRKGSFVVLLSIQLGLPKFGLLVFFLLFSIEPSNFEAV